MKITNIDFKSGIIIYNEFPFMSNEDSYKKEANYLGEDLVLVEYSDNYILDVSWRPFMSQNGNFVISVIKDCNWDDPVSLRITRDFQRLKKYIQESVDLIMNLINGNTNLKEKTALPCNFDRQKFIAFFDEECINDEESSSYTYFVTLEKKLELEVFILGIDSFASVKLCHKKPRSTIFDIGFEEVKYLKINEDSDGWSYLDLYKEVPIQNMSDERKPYKRITIKPNVSLELTVS